MSIYALSLILYSNIKAPLINLWGIPYGNLQCTIDLEDFEFKAVCTACDIIKIKKIEDLWNKYGVSVKCGIGFIVEMQ